MRNNPVPPRDIHNSCARMKTLRHNPRLQLQRPTPVPTPRLNHLAPTHKTVPTIRHANLPMRRLTFWQHQNCSEIYQFNGTETAHTKRRTGADQLNLAFAPHFESQACILESHRFGEVDPEAIPPALVPASHFGGGVTKLLLDVTLVYLRRRSQARAQAVAGIKFDALPFW